MHLSSFLSDGVKISVIAAPATAATTAVTSSAIDMTANGGWDGCLIVARYGTAAANNVIKLQQCDTTGGTYADLEGSEVNAGASDEIQWIDVIRPRESFLKCVASRGTSSTLDLVVAIQYKGRTMPQTALNQLAGTIAGHQLYSPPEGTA